MTYFDGFNVAFSRAALDALDGLDEYLETGGARDLDHRLAANDYDVVWPNGMAVRRGMEAPVRRPGDTSSPHSRTAGGPNTTGTGSTGRSPTGWSRTTAFDPRPLDDS